MSIKKIQKSLEDIKNHRPINLLGFKNLLADLNLRNKSMANNIEAKRVGSQKYIVNHIPYYLWYELEKLANTVNSDRISAAQQNLSHSHNVLGSFIVLRHHNQPLEILEIDVNGDYKINRIMSSQALLIENRQLFISIQATLDFLYSQTNYPKDESLDIIFAAGNEIANKQHKKFLSQYQHLYCLFDVDLGGLLIAKNLYDLLDHSLITWLMPDNIEQRLQNVVLKCDEGYIEKVLKLGQQQPKLKYIVNLIAQHYKILEQEEYLC